MNLLLRGLLVVCVVASAGCGSLRRMEGEAEYLRQHVYDYDYDVPLDTLWETARQMGREVRDETRGEDGVRTALIGIPRLSADGSSYTHTLYARAWEERGRSHLIFVDLRSREEPSDILRRDADAELELISRFEPDEAKRIREGAKKAGQRAR
ncbi:hypothetical protein ACN47A_19220 [Myxococcus fulvus]|uniref:hypothetical protein n=1 Tax=Myxococcus fulvus TaxID=33 RepID=UPI003B9A506E